MKEIVLRNKTGREIHKGYYDTLQQCIENCIHNSINISEAVLPACCYELYDNIKQELYNCGETAIYEAGRKYVCDKHKYATRSDV